MEFMVEDERVQILMDLGLTLLQAKVYLALSQTETATIKTISKIANIARQDIYRIMPTLEKLGLAEKIVAEPTMYKAIPIREGCYILLQKKTREHAELQEKTTNLIKKAHHENNAKTTLQEESQFIVTSSKMLMEKKLTNGIDKAQISIDITSEYRHITFELFKNRRIFEKALARGVRVRVITEKNENENEKAIERMTQTLRKSPLFEIRDTLSRVQATLAIFDGKEVNLCLVEPPENVGVPSLWSNNRPFAKVFAEYFEELWKKAQDALENLTSKNVKLKHPQTAVQQQ
jgi:sugar-specific transcriptional regulator TrmB